jgi:PAS domain S-box-containing protein
VNNNLSKTGEKENYRTFYLASDINQARLGLTVLLFPIAAFIFNDYNLFGLSSPFYFLCSLRAGLFTFTLFMIFFLNTITGYDRYDKSVTVWEVAVGVSSVIITLTRPATFIADQIIIAVIFIFVICLVIPNRLLYQTISSLILAIGILGVAILNFNVVTLTALLSLLFSSALAISLSWQIMAYRKQSYQETENRQKTEEALRASEERFRSLVESTSDWIWQVDQNAVYTYISPKIKDILGYEPEEVLGKTPFELMPKEEARKMTKFFEETVKKQSSFSGLENWNVHKNGTLILLETSGVPIKNEKGDLVGYRGVDRDVTKRKKAEEELRQSRTKLQEYATNLERLVEERTRKMEEGEQSYRELYESFDEAFIATDWEFNVIHWNKAAERITKVAAENALGEKIFNVLPEMMSVDVTPYFEALQQKKNARFIMNTISRETGRPSVFEISTYPSARGISIVVEDKTEEERTKRLSAIGETAGMIGHDIRNPLQVIINELFVARIELDDMVENPSKAAIKESLAFVEQQTNYIDKIITDLQDYARPLTPELVEVDLCAAIPQVMATLNIPDNIRSNVTCVEQTVKTAIDMTFLRRIMTNLCTNAFQAMPKGGTLTVNVLRKDDKACITVEDTGVGIPKEVQSKLFTPLFTTKAKGQGFGLVAIKRMIEALGGTINFESEEGKGTMFIVELPINFI